MSQQNIHLNASPLPLHLRELSLRAGGAGRLLVSGLSLSIEPGQRWALLGPNGAGKSTLLAAVAGLALPAGGELRIGERVLAQWPARELVRQRAWCPQFWLDPFPASSWETVACAVVATQPAVSAQRAEDVARDWLQRFDVGALADSDVRTLSGGERQRVALATACAQAAPLLLLDEPTAHLDWAHQVLLQPLLTAWSAAGGTVFAAVHDLNMAWSFATHALLLDGRGGFAAGTRDEILQAAPLSHAYAVPVSVLEEGDARWFRVDLSATGNGGNEQRKTGQ
ncbi:ABC transporter ATP-binding protein [Uliginosibacterium sp. H1]|uniref:ABC transporter ATP-binding protein n=1 Tax=Uliginosibacterium sp. H1 TaxID=3114757 RepID=UPI002E199DDD|nr:ABC transporter ATP-binding protein [Uliginosibacterium sp. H1]